MTGWTALRATLLAASLAIALPGAGNAEPGPFDLDALMRGMASSRGVVAKFVEEKHLALLEAPIESRGVLYFAPPGRLARFTVAPAKSALVIDGEQLRFREGKGSEEFDLSGDPMAKVFVENFIVLWTGDRKALESLYETNLSGVHDAWALRLSPRSAPLDRVMEAITLLGGREGIAEIVMLSSDGDRTVTRLSDVDADRAFSPDELATLFEKRVPLAQDPPGR